MANEADSGANNGDQGTAGTEGGARTETQDRKQWIEDRLEMLDSCFAVSVGGFAVMDNHLHVLCRLDPEDAKAWTAEEVIHRWITVYPPANIDLDDEKIVKMWVDHAVKDTKRVEVLRERLSNLGWFMKALKEPLARMANRADGVKGAFWDARYKSIAILDEESLLATCAYIDLNPLAAGIAARPETSRHTSIRQRVRHADELGKLDQLKAARDGSVSASRAAGNVEQGHWLVPIEDRRSHTNARSKSGREGMLETFSLGTYLLLVDYTGRLFRNGKARMGAAVKEVFERLETSQEFWDHRIKKMLGSNALRGTFHATNQQQIHTLAEERGKRTANLSPQAA